LFSGHARINSDCKSNFWTPRGGLTLNLTLDSAFNEPQCFYRYTPAWMGNTTITGTTITAGISGQF
jgi:hypothetical protein